MSRRKEALPTSEWDFSWIDAVTVPDWRVEQCLFWEYLREVCVEHEELKGRLLQYREGKDLDSSGRYILNNNNLGSIICALLSFSEWPEKAYCDLAFRDKLWEGNHPALWHIPVDAIKAEEIEAVSGDFNGTSVLEQWCWESDEIWDSEKMEWTQKKEPASVIAFTYATFELDWRMPPTQMVKAFEEWVSEYRKSRPVATKLNTQGNGERRRLKALIKALGAYRLRKRYKLNEARAYVQKELKGADLYENDSEWSTANTRAKRFMARQTVAVKACLRSPVNQRGLRLV
jgi:hypothetical protein